MKIKGIHPHRLYRYPEELRFAKAWDSLHDLDPRFTDTLLETAEERERTGVPLPASERDVAVAATVAQWFGSPVGNLFLRGLGYVKAE